MITIRKEHEENYNRLKNMISFQGSAAPAAATAASSSAVISAATSAAASCGAERALPLHRVLPRVLGVRAGVEAWGRRGEDLSYVAFILSPLNSTILALNRDWVN